MGKLLRSARLDSILDGDRTYSGFIRLRDISASKHALILILLNSEEDITLCFGGCAHCDCEINWPSVQSNPAHFSNGHNQRSRKVIAQQK